VGVNKKRFNSLVSIYLSGPFRITQRAAWPLSVCVMRCPALILPHLTSILNFVKKPGVHDAVKRNTVRLLQFIEVPKKYRGKVLDICFEFMNDKKQAIAIRVFSMTVIANVANHEPELLRELVILIEDELSHTSSPAFRSRARKILQGIGRNFN
jgi:hypothetical protein